MGRCFLVACDSFVHDRYLVWLLSTTVCHNMWSTDIPCRLFKPSSRRASVSIVSLVTHAGVSSLMVFVHVVNSPAFSKSWNMGAQVLAAVSQRKKWRQIRTDGKKAWAYSMRAGGGTARGHGECGAGTRDGAGPRLGPLCGTSNCWKAEAFGERVLADVSW